MSAGAAPPQLFNGVPIPPPPGIDLSVDRYPQILISQVVTYVFAFIAFSLRIVSRKSTGVGLWWDDYLVFPAIVRLSTFRLPSRRRALISIPKILATATLGFRSPPHGFGQHVWAVGWDTQSTELLKLFAGEVRVQADQFQIVLECVTDWLLPYIDHLNLPTILPEILASRPVLARLQHIPSDAHSHLDHVWAL